MQPAHTRHARRHHLLARIAMVVGVLTFAVGPIASFSQPSDFRPTACLDLIGSLELSSPGGGGPFPHPIDLTVHALHLQRDRLFAARGELGVTIIDVSDPSQAVELATYNTLGEALDLKVVNTTAYVADGSRGLLTLDVTDPTMPRGLDAIFGITDARGIDIVGNLTFVAAHQQGLRIADVTNPLVIFEIGTFEDGNEAQDVVIDGELAHLADGSGGLRILDIEVPAAPVQLSEHPTSGFASEVTVEGPRGYVVGSSQMEIFDLSDPARPTLLGGYDGCEPRQVVVEGSLGYLACDASVEVLDVQDPAAVRVLAQSSLVDGYASVELGGGVLFVGDHVGGLWVFDVSGCTALHSDGFESGDVSGWSGAG